MYRAGRSWFRETLSVAAVAMMLMASIGVSEISAQDATPEADSTEIATEVPEPTVESTAEPDSVESQAPDDDNLVASTPDTSKEVASPTAPPTEFLNTDSLEASDAPGAVSLEAGASQTFVYTYRVTTPRIGTTLRASVLDEGGNPAAGWTISIQDVPDSFRSEIEWTESQSLQPDSSFIISMVVQAPAELDAPVIVSLHISSYAALDNGSTEMAVVDAGPLASIDAQPSARSGESTPEVNDPKPPLEASPEATPVAATPEPIVENTDSFKFEFDISRPVEIVAGQELLGPVSYLVTTPRVSTTIHAEIVDAETGQPAKGWVVGFNGAGTGSSVDLSNLVTIAAGSTFKLTFSVKSNPKARAGKPGLNVVLRFSSTVVGGDGTELTKTPAKAEIAFNVKSAGFSAQSVSDGSSQLDCQNANVVFTNQDSISPGQIIEFPCTFTITGLSVLTTIDTTLTLAAPTNWAISATPALELVGGTQVFGSETVFSAGPQSFSTSTVLGVLVSKSAFKVRLRAPLDPIPASGASAVATITVASRCHSVLTLGDCASSTIRTSTLTATVNMTQLTTGGGQLPVAALGLAAGTILFNLQCNPPSPGYTVQPGQIVTVECTLTSALSLSALQALVNLDGTVAAQASSPSWSGQLLLAPGHGVGIGSGSTSLTLLQVLTADASSVDPFTLFFVPGCTSDSSIESVKVTATYNLTLLAGTAVAVTQSYAVVPVQVSGSPILGTPVATGATLNFGNVTWNGSAYTPKDTPTGLTISLLQAAIGCRATNWRVQISVSAMTNAGGGTIPATSLSYVGATSTNGNLVPVSSLTGLSTSATTIATGTDLVPSGASLGVTFRVAPPNTAPAGSYSGTITFTVASGP